MKQKLFYYFKKIRFILFAIALVIAFIGSYQYHFNEYASPIKGIQVVLYSTVKLFAFSPTSFVTGEAPLLYEIAVWLAPAVTMVGFFSLFQKIYQSIKFGIFHIGKKHILLLGDNDNTVEFIKSINREKDKTAAILLCDISDSVDEEKYKNLLTKVVRIDFSNPEDPINRMTLRDEKLGKRIRVVSFEEEPKNFGLISKLHQMKFWDHIVEVYVETKNYRIKELIEARMDQLKDFDLHYFNIQELLVKKLMEDSSFNFNPIAGFNDDWSEKTFSSMEEISEELGTFNILIIGFSEISEHFLSQASNLLTVNPLKNLSVTVIDSSVSRFNNFINSRKMISKVIDFEFIEVGEAAYKIKPEAEKRHLDKTFSAVFFGFDDVNKNIILVDNLIREFSHEKLNKEKLYLLDNSKLIISNDGNFVGGVEDFIVGEGKAIDARIYIIDTRNSKLVFADEKARYTAKRGFSPDSKYVYFTVEINEIYIYNIIDNKLVKKITTKNDFFNDAKIDSSSKYIYASFAEGISEVYRISDGKFMGDVVGTILNIDILDDEKISLDVIYNNQASRYENFKKVGKDIILTPRRSEHGVSLEEALVYNPEKDLLLSIKSKGEQNYFYLIDFKTGGLIQAFENIKGPYSPMAYITPDAKKIGFDFSYQSTNVGEESKLDYSSGYVIYPILDYN